MENNINELKKQRDRSRILNIILIIIIIILLLLGYVVGSKIGKIGVKDIELGKWRYLKDREIQELIKNK